MSALLFQRWYIRGPSLFPEGGGPKNTEGETNHEPSDGGGGG